MPFDSDRKQRQKLVSETKALARDQKQQQIFICVQTDLKNVSEAVKLFEE